MKIVDKNLDVPLHIQLYKIIKDMIESGKLKEVMDYAMERICYYLNKRTKGNMKIDCIMYANEFGELARSKEAAEWFTLLEQEQVQ